MTLFKGLFWVTPKKKLEISRPEHVCPNCWGQQEYANKIRDAVYDKQIDVNNHKKIRSFITKYVEDQITGSYLQKDVKDTVYCPKCRMRYHHISFSSGV